MGTDNQDAMTAEQQLQLMQEAGVNQVNNAWISGRMPPAESFGINPLGFYAVYDSGDLMTELHKQLGEPMPSPRKDFNQVAPNETNEVLASLNKSFNPKSSV